MPNAEATDPISEVYGHRWLSEGRGAVSVGKDPNTAKVREAMSEHIIYCFDDQDTGEAADVMKEKQIRRLAVLSHDKRLVGVLSLGDIVERAGDEDAAGQALEGISHPTGKPRNV